MDHIEACLENKNIRIVALVDKCQDARQKGCQRIQDTYGNTPLKCYNGLRELADDDSLTDELDGVILALPHNVYAGEWDNILKLNVPILKEKPLGRDLSEAIHFLNEAQNRGVTLMTAVQRRYHPAYRAMREIISDQTVRSIRVVYCLGRNKPSKSKEWRQDLQKAGGAMLLDAGYHMMDLVQFLVGTVHLVSATLTKDANGREIPCGRTDLEDHCYLTVSKDAMLISIECHLFGRKAERILVDIVDDGGNGGLIELTRGIENFELRSPGSNLLTFDKDWKSALKYQVDEFVEHIKERSLDFQRVAYSQLPVQRIIHDAYALADPYASGMRHHTRNTSAEDDNAAEC